MTTMHNWFGVGIKGGGTLALVGFETMEGYISCVGMPSHTHSINMSYMRLGAGLGGGVGLCLIFVYNSINPKALDNTSDSTWSVNIALGPKWSAIASALAKSKIFELAPKIVGGIAAATKYDLDNIRNAASNIYTGLDVMDQNSKNKVVTIDVPGAGVGAELSLQKLYGTIFIGDIQMQETNIDKSGLPSGGIRRGEL